LLIYYPDILEETTPSTTFSYIADDLILYALGIGMGRNPLDDNERRYICEVDLLAVPTAATVLDKSIVRPVMHGSSPGHRRSSITHDMVLLAEQKTELHRPMRPHDRLHSVTRVADVIDKGKNKGAIIAMETVWRDDAGEKVVTLTISLFARADGGFGGPSKSPPQTPPPARTPDLTVEYETRPDQAALYRLCGDKNLLHIDPQAARRAGFERPILHGMCTYGIACRAVLQHCVDYDAGRILSHRARFSAPVLPGDTILVDLWQDGDLVSFQARSKESGLTVMKNGQTLLRPS
jgi:acyl dehydratase